MIRCRLCKIDISVTGGRTIFSRAKDDEDGNSAEVASHTHTHTQTAAAAAANSAVMSCDWRTTECRYYHWITCGDRPTPNASELWARAPTVRRVLANFLRSRRTAINDRALSDIVVYFWLQQTGRRFKGAQTKKITFSSWVRCDEA